VSGREAASAAPFEAFFRRAYRPLIRDVIFAGGDLYEAEDAVAAAMEEVLQRWDTIESPQAYTRRAAISNLIEAKTRGTSRVVNRPVQQGEVPAEYTLDPGLTVWEQQEWVTALLLGGNDNDRYHSVRSVPGHRGSQSLGGCCGRRTAG
jgi:DNA-directed RNA polymerase specialized sigma24 family protein